MTAKASLLSLAFAVGGCALPPGSSGVVEGGLLTGGATVRWSPPRRSPDWREWDDCFRAQLSLRHGNPCRCVIAFRALGDLREFASCYAQGEPAPIAGRATSLEPPPDILDALKRRLRADEGLSDGTDGHVGYGSRLPLDAESAEALLEVAARRAVADADPKTVSDKIAALSASGAAPPPAGEYVPRAEYDRLAGEVKSMRAADTERVAQAAVASATAAGKITPAMREWALSQARADVKQFSAFVQSAPVVLDASERSFGETQRVKAVPSGEMLRTLGVDRKSFDESGQRLGGAA